MCSTDDKGKGVDFKKLREPESTEMVECGYCGEMVVAKDCEWRGCWICPCCMKRAWDDWSIQAHT